MTDLQRASEITQQTALRGSSWKWIWDTRKSYTRRTMHIRWHQVVQKEWMSEYQHDLLGVGVAPTEFKKLVPNLRDKERYELHYRNLQLYLFLGMRLKKIHRALRFKQSAWMEPYIHINTELRKRATNGFEKALYKLMKNSVFGKTMENLRKHVDIKLVRKNEEGKFRQKVEKNEG